MLDKIRDKNELNFIDLFAGAGGLSEGFMQAGFNPIAHVEMNAFAAQTLVTRSAYYYLKENNQLHVYYQYIRGDLTQKEFLEKIPSSIKQSVICEMMSDATLPYIFNTIDEIMKLRNIQTVDVVIGGPPCQAYSLVGTPSDLKWEDKVVAIVEARDGTILDVVRKIKPYTLD